MSKNICLVVKNHHIAKRVQEYLPDNWLVIGCGAAVVGHHFDLILFANGWNDESNGMKALEWAGNLTSNRRKSDETLVIY